MKPLLILWCTVAFVCCLPPQQYFKRQQRRAFQQAKPKAALPGRPAAAVEARRPQRRIIQQRQAPTTRSSGSKIVIPYNYGYEIRDSKTMNFQNKAEMQDEFGNVFGSYSVLMPDGIIYTTSYNVSGDSGFVVRITKTPAAFS